MKGIIAVCLKEMVIERFGIEKWEAVLINTGETQDISFLATGDIDDKYVMSLIKAMCRAVNLSKEEIADIFGEYWVSTFSQKVYGGLYMLPQVVVHDIPWSGATLEPFPGGAWSPCSPRRNTPCHFWFGALIAGDPPRPSATGRCCLTRPPAKSSVSSNGENTKKPWRRCGVRRRISGPSLPRHPRMLAESASSFFPARRDIPPRTCYSLTCTGRSPLFFLPGRLLE